MHFIRISVPTVCKALRKGVTFLLKRAYTIMTVILFLLMTFPPLLRITVFLLGYRVECIRTYGLTFVVAIFSASTLIAGLGASERNIGRVRGLLSVLLTPLSVIYTLSLYQKSGISAEAVCLTATVICSAVISVVCGRPQILKAIMLTVSVLPILASLVIGSALADIRTVVKSRDLPGGRYRIEVVDSDQGALGGNTLIYLCTRQEIGVLFFRIKEKPKLIYTGDYGEWESSDFDETIDKVINETVYKQ